LGGASLNALQDLALVTVLGPTVHSLDFSLQGYLAFCYELTGCVQCADLQQVSSLKYKLDLSKYIRRTILLVGSCSDVAYITALHSTLTRDGF
jgi:hypothetical protein